MATRNRFFPSPFYCDSTHFVLLAAELLAIPGPRFRESRDSRSAILCRLASDSVTQLRQREPQSPSERNLFVRLPPIQTRVLIYFLIFLSQTLPAGKSISDLISVELPEKAVMQLPENFWGVNFRGITKKNNIPVSPRKIDSRMCGNQLPENILNSVHTRCIVKTSGFTRGVCKNRGFY